MSDQGSIDPGLIGERNQALARDLDADFASLGAILARRGIRIEDVLGRAHSLEVAIPSWGLVTGGTRFARFPIEGEPRNVLEKLEDHAVVQALVRMTPRISLHLPWDRPEDPRALAEAANAHGLGFDAVNSNTFEDQEHQELSYKFGSLTHTDPAVRAQAVEHNLECVRIGRSLGAKALTVWIGDGGNFPGQVHFRRAFDRYVESLHAIARGLPADWRMFLEHKLYEPAFYSTVNNDWGTSYAAATAVGAKCQCLVDLGHHAPTVNIEMIVARLLAFGKLGGFHLNDSKYGDDDLDAGSVHPFQLFLIMNEMVDAEIQALPGFRPSYLLDQSHNVTDPIESLIASAVEVQRAYVKAHLVDREALARAQDGNDPLIALETLRTAFNTDVGPILGRARFDRGGAVDPIGVFRASSYRKRRAAERPAVPRRGGGIV